MNSNLPKDTPQKTNKISNVKKGTGYGNDFAEGQNTKWDIGTYANQV